MSQLQPVVIVGAGPAGVGAAGRLQKLGEDWLVAKREDYVGGADAVFTAAVRTGSASTRA